MTSTSEPAGFGYLLDNTRDNEQKAFDTEAALVKAYLRAVGADARDIQRMERDIGEMTWKAVLPAVGCLLDVYTGSTIKPVSIEDFFRSPTKTQAWQAYTDIAKQHGEEIVVVCTGGRGSSVVITDLEFLAAEAKVSVRFNVRGRSYYLMMRKEFFDACRSRWPFSLEA